MNGNLRFQRSPDGTVLQAYQWDAKNRLVKILEGTQETEFAYDGKDRRVLKIERTHGSEISRTHYIWEGSNIVQSRAADASTLQRNYFQQGFQENAQNYYYTKDHLGSIREVVANDGITIEAAYDYSPCGEVTKISGTGVESDFLYTGHFYHSESDLHLTFYRAYNPELGMWLSRDPIARVLGLDAEIFQGPNLYQYGFNDPVNNVDNNGLWTIGGGISGGFEFMGYSAGFSIGIYLGYDPDCPNHRLSGGILGSGGVGGGVIGSASIGLFGQVTNANRVSDLKGRGFDAGANIGQGLVGGVSVVGNGGDYVGLQGELGVGGGAPVGVHGLLTKTVGLDSDFGLDTEGEFNCE